MEDFHLVQLSVAESKVASAAAISQDMQQGLSLPRLQHVYRGLASPACL